MLFDNVYCRTRMVSIELVNILNILNTLMKNINTNILVFNEASSFNYNNEIFNRI